MSEDDPVPEVERYTRNTKEQIISVYGRESPLTVTRGKVHEYLGITIGFTDKDRVKFTMYDYIYNMLEDIPEDKNIRDIRNTSSGSYVRH